MFPAPEYLIKKVMVDFCMRSAPYYIPLHSYLALSVRFPYLHAP